MTTSLRQRLIAAGLPEPLSKRQRAKQEAFSTCNELLATLRQLEPQLQELFGEEYREIGCRVSSPHWNLEYEWIVTFKLKPDRLSVSLSRLVRIGRSTHRYWRGTDEFPERLITGKFVRVQRDTRGRPDVNYDIILTDVKGYEVKRPLFMSVPVQDIVELVKVELIPRQDKSEKALNQHRVFAVGKDWK